jgi:hypothetical protein
VEKSETEFESREHVLQDAFGGFAGAPTLTDPIVCDSCNQEFGDTIDLYLTRDTPIGLARFLFGQKSPDEYKSLGRRSTMRTQLTEGRRAGATVLIHPSDDGPLGLRPLPQIGLGKTVDGPFRWFFCSELASSKEEIRALIQSGHHSVELLEVMDVQQMLDTLRELGLQIVNDPIQTAPAGNFGIHRTESAALLMQTFGRAIAKIGMNYLASQHGSTIARMAAFDDIRKYIRHAKPLPVGTWWSKPVPPGVERRWHWIVVMWDSTCRRVVAEVCFFGAYRYRVVLAAGGGFLLDPPFPPRGHRYNLTTMKVDAIPRSELDRLILN